MSLLILIFITILFIVCICIPMLFKSKDIDGYSYDDKDFIQPFFMSNLLTKEDCDAIINISRDKLQKSAILSGEDDKIRNSRQAWIEKDDPLVSNLFNKLSNIFNIPIENAESLQVVNYQPNQYYNEHHDSCCDDTNFCKKFVSEGGQRILTILIYLNDNFSDGETYFKNLGIKYKAKIGDAIVFFPLAKNSNKCHIKSLHAGLPISAPLNSGESNSNSSAEKWVANVWFRKRKFR